MSSSALPGPLAAIGPFAIEMHIPVLSSMADHLQTNAAEGLHSRFGITQIICGPVSEMVGRKPSLYFGLAVFPLALIGCTSAPLIDRSMGLRFIQGNGSASVRAIPRAVIGDWHTGVEAIRPRRWSRSSPSAP